MNMKILALALSFVVLLMSAFGVDLTALSATEPLEISITTTEFGISPVGTPVQLAWEEAMEKMLGREINFRYEFVNIGDYGTKCELILSTGVLPDILTIGWVDHAKLLQYGEKGLFVELTQHWDELPNYSAVFESDYNAPKKCMSTDGKVYAFYNASYYPDGNPYLNVGSAVRTDILEELGLDIPVTLEEFYEVAREIKAARPDCYPVFQHEDWETPEAAVMAYYGTSTGRYWNGTEYAYGPVEEAYREGLRYLNRLYTEELISPDYFTHTSEDGIAAVANGDVYMALNLWNGYCNSSNWGKTNAGEGWTLIPWLSSEDGYREGDAIFNPGADTPWNMSTAYSRVVNANSEHVEECLAILDYTYGEEIRHIRTWGVEGITYNVSDEGQFIFTPEYVNGDLQGTGLGDGNCRAGIFPEVQVRSMDVVLQTTKSMPIYDIFTEELITEVEDVYAMRNISEAYCSHVAPSFTLSSSDSAEYANIYNLVKTVADEYRVAFIKGEYDLDEDWDSYLQALNEAGNVEEMLNYYNKYLNEE